MPSLSATVSGPATSSSTPAATAAPFPGGKEFAFTVFDDTDDGRVEDLKPMYQLLQDLGLRTTKTVWPVACPEGSEHFFAGQTLADDAYLRFCQGLQRAGFEITWHGATMESSTRERTQAALDAFASSFGAYPRLHANHALNRECIYWGAKRFQSGLRHIVRLKQRRGGPTFQGEDRRSEYFWGDLCLAHCQYVRNFTCRDVNTLHFDPYTPYHLRETPFVRYWFSATDAHDVDAFATLVTPRALDRLRQQRGACILFTHFGKGFVSRGRIDPRVVSALRYLATLGGWYVPAGELLDHLLATSGGCTLSKRQLLWLELRYTADRVWGRR